MQRDRAPETVARLEGLPFALRITRVANVTSAVCATCSRGPTFVDLGAIRRGG